MKPVLPANIREFSPHGLMFAVYPVNTTPAALQASGKVQRVSDEVLKHIKMRKQTFSKWCLLGYCRSLSYRYPPCSSGVATSISVL